MFNFLKNRKTPRTHESPAPSEDRERLQRGLSPRRGQHQDNGSDGNISRRRAWAREDAERYRVEETDSMQSLTPKSIPAQHGVAVRMSRMSGCIILNQCISMLLYVICLLECLCR